MCNKFTLNIFALSLPLLNQIFFCYCSTIFIPEYQNHKSEIRNPKSVLRGVPDLSQHPVNFKPFCMGCHDFLFNGIAKIGMFQVCIAQVRKGKVCMAQVGITQVSS
jgi:hypothetical protein